MRNPVRLGGVDVPARWLRDHGDDPASVDPESLQRRVDTFSIPRDVAAVSVVEEGAVATVSWSDGATTSHDVGALRRVVERPRSPRPAGGVLTIEPLIDDEWVGRASESVRPISVLDDDDAWVEALRDLRCRGWVAFDGAAAGPEPVERLAARVGYPRRSIFGTVWEMKPGAEEHKDSAYETIALDLHTDGTYSHDGPGTIIFSQQEKVGDGGDSVLVDGFAVARDLLAVAPEAADLLTRYDVLNHYVEPGVHLCAERPVLRVDAGGTLRQVSLNNYDRAPVLPAEPHIDEVLDAYALFHRMVHEPERAVRLPWTPGRMLIIDNWRMLHGRTQYSGIRTFLGCYTNHEDLESAWRVAGVV